MPILRVRRTPRLGNANGGTAIDREATGASADRDRRDRRRMGVAKRKRGRRPAGQRPPERRQPEEPIAPPPAVDVRFVPAIHVVESVLAQIKAGHLAYSVFSLGRMFLDKPERYDVRLKTEAAALFQLGENGPVASDQRVLENGAFLSEKDNFYRAEVTQSEPIKGNFTSIARCRLSGVLLGPPNHHAYQPQLRSLYEQRFSRRMSFPEYQRQVEIVANPEAVERWKEEARSITSYVTLQEEPPLTFRSPAETERHFRQTYLPGLLRSSAELTLDGVVSRRLADRSLGRAIEDAWAHEYRSPSKMMQELIERVPAGWVACVPASQGNALCLPGARAAFQAWRGGGLARRCCDPRGADRQAGHQSQATAGKIAPGGRSGAWKRREKEVGACL